MTVQNPAIFLQNVVGGHPAEDTRRFIGAAMSNRPGIVASGDLAVTQNGTPNMSVNVAGGQAFILGSQGTYQGTYFVENRGVTNLAIAAADGTNPRRDLVVAKVEDSQYLGTVNAWSLVVVTGVPNATPADPTPPPNSFVLASVLVGAGVTSITNANITDRRTTPSLYPGNLGGRAAALGGVITCTSTTRPTSPATGQRIYETDTSREFVWTGSVWRHLSVYICTSSTRPTGSLLYDGLFIHETDTNRDYVYSGTAWRHTGIYVCTSSTRPTGTFLYDGLHIYETDTNRDFVYNGSSFVATSVISCTSSTRPTSSLIAGLQIYETDTDNVLVYTGSAWRLVSAPISSATLTTGFTNVTGGSVSISWQIIGSSVIWSANFTAGTATAANSISLTLPAAIWPTRTVPVVATNSNNVLAAQCVNTTGVVTINAGVTSGTNFGVGVSLTGIRLTGAWPI